MAIKFKPLDDSFYIKGQESFQREALSLLKCILNRLENVEKHLEIISDEEEVEDL